MTKIAKIEKEDSFAKSEKASSSKKLMNGGDRTSNQQRWESPQQIPNFKFDFRSKHNSSFVFFSFFSFFNFFNFKIQVVTKTQRTIV